MLHLTTFHNVSIYVKWPQKLVMSMSVGGEVQGGGVNEIVGFLELWGYIFKGKRLF